MSGLIIKVVMPAKELWNGQMADLKLWANEQLGEYGIKWGCRPGYTEKDHKPIVIFGFCNEEDADKFRNKYIKAEE